jgi:hypothetical protein
MNGSSGCINPLLFFFVSARKVKEGAVSGESRGGYQKGETSESETPRTDSE